jgi:hypothetical protein
MVCAWKRIPSIPKIKLLRGEPEREFVLFRDDESRCLDALPADMRPTCTFPIDMGLRVGGAFKMEWPQVNLHEQPSYLTVRAGQAKSSKRRTAPLTPQARRILEAAPGGKGIVFRNAEGEQLCHTWLEQQQACPRKLFSFPPDSILLTRSERG